MILSASRRKSSNLNTLHWVLLGLLALVYPIIASIYNFLPVFFGLCSYLLVVAIKKQNIPLIIVCTMYSISLEINFSMPIFNIIISALTFYVLIYNRLKLFANCNPCIAIMSVISIYVIYFITLFIDDIVFSRISHVINIDWLFLFNLFIDIFSVVII